MKNLNLKKIDRIKTKVKNRYRSFIFVETMVVISVLVVFATQFNSGVQKFIQKQKVNAAKRQIEIFRSALQSYYIDVGKFPASENGLLCLWKKAETENENWQGPYVNKEIPKDPWKNEYLYCRKENIYELEMEDIPEGLPFAIVSFGSDGKIGGSGNEEDIVSWK